MTISYKSITELFLYNVLFIAYIEGLILAYFSEFVKLFLHIQCRFYQLSRLQRDSINMVSEAPQRQYS
jgi:hypothetical protein